MPRLHCPAPLQPGALLSLPPGAARHVQVLRLQPGDALTLFDGTGGEHDAEVVQMGRSEVQVRVGEHRALEREAPCRLHFALGIPANERMDWLVEKATELGAASIQPLMTERSVLRLAGERADKKRAHWQAIAVAASEQCGRNRVPVLHAPATLTQWLAAQAAAPDAGQRHLLSLADDAGPLPVLAPGAAATFLSGPEGGLSPAEETAARTAGFLPTRLGARVLRAETAPLAVLARLALP